MQPGVLLKAAADVKHRAIAVILVATTKRTVVIGATPALSRGAHRAAQSVLAPTPAADSAFIVTAVGVHVIAWVSVTMVTRFAQTASVTVAPAIFARVEVVVFAVAAVIQKTSKLRCAALRP